MYTPFSKGKTFGNQETKIILCAFSHSIHSSLVHNLFVVSFGMIAQKRPKQLFFPQVCSIAEQSMRLHLFAQWILPTSKNPSGTLGPLEYVHYVPMRLLLSAILPFFRSFFPRYPEPRLKKRASKWFYDMCHSKFLTRDLCYPDRSLVREILC